ncbi:LysR family transcriptional regulator [Nocardioides insulae]|uniref:LysR family transcriptional regulator n=1 Tax=Nocardioides insulae TaxID=394734 RepID=UPI0004287972|nr:LysR family transcriptional regulator [Nocardioides insulae]
MEIRQLASFVAVAEELHFGRAAARLHLAQPALSQQIRRLERDLGATLFERNTRSVRLTAAGTALLGPAREVLAAAGVARRSVRAATAGEVGRVTLGYVGASSYDAVPRLSRAVAADLPGIELVLRSQTYSGEALGQIAAGDLDLGFVSWTQRPGISMRVVRDEELVVALPDSHPLADREEIAVEELAGERFVTFPAARGSAVREAMTDLCHEAGFVPTVAQEVPDAYNLLTLVGAGLGVAVVVESSRRIQLDHVVFRPLAGRRRALPIALAWRSRHESPALEAVLRVAERVLPSLD